MNYSKKGIEQKQQYIKSTSRRLTSKLRIVFFRLFIITVVVTAIIGVYAGLGYIKGLIDSAPNISLIDVAPKGFTTYVYDSESNVIEQLVGAHANREYIEIDQIPKIVQDAFVAIEDERFYDHDGIDVRGIFRAFVLGVKAGGDFDQGASTITQQLLKNQVFDGGMELTFIDRMERKIQEQYLAIQLENKLEKPQILEYYLNNINLGSGTYGVRTAAKRYFNKEVQELTLSEAAVLAAIAQLPVYHNPITNPEKNEVRKNDVLRKMLQLGKCTQEEYDYAMADDVYSRIQTVNEEYASTSYYSYFVDELIEQVIKDLQNKLGYTQTQASNLLYSGGLRIITTQDPTIQRIVDEIFADESFFPEIGISFWELNYALSIQKNDPEKTTIHYHKNDLLNFFKDYPDPDNLYVDDKGSKFSLLFKDKDDMQKRIDEFREAMLEDGDIVLGEKVNMTIQPQLSFVIMDQHTGHVMAIIGGRGEKTGNRTLNRATFSKRQPGSTFKILSTYLPALDTAGFTLASVQDDAPYYYPDTQTEVSNWRSKKVYEGLSTLRKGIYDSMNIVTVKTLAEVTPRLGYDYLKKLGFTTIVESRTEADGRVVSDINLPMALGGLTDGVTNLELTAAFATIANKGVYVEPIFYTKILDANGKVLLENEPKKEQVFKESTAWLLTNAMEDVVNIGTGKVLKLKEIDMPVAGKTGSTSDYNDLWFSGYTPYYTATIWAGFDNNRPQTEGTFNRIIWRTIMERVHIEKGLEKKTFTMPDSIVTAKICTKSGKLAVEGLCDHYIGGDATRVEYFAKGTEPTEKCDMHVKATICTESSALATEYCPIHTLKEAVYLNKTETGVTHDTPYVLPTKKCTIHTGIYYEDEPPYPPSNNDGLEDDFEDEFEDFNNFNSFNSFWLFPQN